MSVFFGILAGVTVAVVTWGWFFRDADDFWECISYCLKPNIFSWFDGSYSQDVRSEVKLSLWVALAIIIGVITTGAIERTRPRAASPSVKEAPASRGSMPAESAATRR